MMRLIDADALSNKLGEWWNIPKDWDGGMAQACEDAFTAIDDAPTIDAQPVVHGKWIDVEEYVEEGVWRCSVCGDDRYFEGGTPAEHGCYYCPNCGAKMEG